jgi:polyhydroxyalkanoate synthesis regulator phasin
MTPSWAGAVWHDGQSLFLQLPESGHITRLSLTEGGLNKALNLIQQRCYINGHSKVVKLPAARKVSDRFGEAQRQSAEEDEDHMSDIVDLLRSHKAGLGHGQCQDCYGSTMDDAADEIVLLRERVREREGRIDALRLEVMDLNGLVNEMAETR